MQRYLLLLIFSWALSGCSSPKLYQQQSYVFGTLVEVSVYGAPKPQAERAMAAVLARFDELHRALHAWQPSELSSLNAALAKRQRMRVSPELATLLRDAQALAAESDDLFNPAIGGLIALWGFHADTQQARVPDAVAISQWVHAAPRMRDLHIENGEVWSVNPSVQIDLGGYVKGYALDEARRILELHGIANALVNIGGNVIALGQHGARPWRVGIQHPRRPGVLATLDLLDGEAVGTSGDYQRYFEVDHRRYSHLIDPRSGRPAEAMQSVTLRVAGPHAGVRSDALSKPLFIAGPAHLKAQASRLGLSDYLAVDAAGQIHVSPAMKPRLR